MKSKFCIFLTFQFLFLFVTINAQDSSKSIKKEDITFTTEGTTFNGYIAYDENLKGKRPAIIVVPEWWGMNDYVKMRARELAKLGYIAMATDFYGKGKIAADPKEAQELATPFYKNPNLGKSRIDAAIEKLLENPLTDAKNIAAIGYCFGGAMVINYAKLGGNVKGVVSFHGNLKGASPKQEFMKAKILVCHGGADKFVSQKEVDAFKHEMDSVKADYKVIVYPNATHAFTNPDATATGKKFNMPIEYNADADQKSWNDMKEFLSKVFNK